MTTAKDAYPFEFVWIDGDRLPFDAWRGRPVVVCNRAAGSSAALTSVLTASISRLPRTDPNELERIGVLGSSHRRPLVSIQREGRNR